MIKLVKVMLWAKRFCVVVIVCYIFLKPVDQRIHIKTGYVFILSVAHSVGHIKN